MDKKNTMLLTVIAVATLLVAVVGATFAYFSVTGSNTSTNTAINTTAEEVGVVSLTDTGDDFYLTLTALQMANGNQKTYYASTDVAATQALTEATPTSVATFAVTGGEADINYYCNFNYTVNVTSVVPSTTGSYASGSTTATEITEAMVKAVLAADSRLILSTPAGTNATINLSELNHNLGTNSSGTGSIMLTGAGATADIAAIVEFDNTNEKQNDLSGAKVVTEFDITGFTCDTKDIRTVTQ